MILVDLNVVLDVIQRREPYYGASASVLESVVDGSAQAVLPAHCLTTLYYIVERYNDRATARNALAWILRHFGIAPIGRAELVRAFEFGTHDYEDAVVAAAAEAAGCTVIVTRNVQDFRGTSIDALTPEEYLSSRNPSDTH